jgi:hypothetical protein
MKGDIILKFLECLKQVYEIVNIYNVPHQMQSLLDDINKILILSNENTGQLTSGSVTAPYYSVKESIYKIQCMPQCSSGLSYLLAEIDMLIDNVLNFEYFNLKL